MALKRDFTPEELAENGRKGGIASGVAKRRKAEMKKTLELLLGMPLQDKKKCHEIVDGSVFDSSSADLYIVGCSHVNYYFYIYVCRECRKEFALTELAEMKRRDF